MNMQNNYLPLLALLLSSFSYAQTEFTWLPNELTPHNEGFYVGGATYSWDGSPSPFFASGCPGEIVNGREIDPEDYERRDPQKVSYDLHNETGEQEGFRYVNGMILPDCHQKFIDDEEQIDPQVSSGFIQLHPCVDSNKDDEIDADSLKWSYIQSPLLRNLVSMTVETSADISIQEGRRHIPYLMEVSLDSGTSWEHLPYIADEVDVRSGNRAVYDESNPDFKEMMNLSLQQNVMLRLITNFDDPDLEEFKGQYVNVHKLSILADSAKAEENEEVVLQSIQVKSHPILVSDGNISVDEGHVQVYTISGRRVGYGRSVQVSSGLYVARTDLGVRKKVLIR